MMNRACLNFYYQTTVIMRFIFIHEHKVIEHILRLRDRFETWNQ